jgi:RNA polymerase II subunit A small phosphatase-like protein
MNNNNNNNRIKVNQIQDSNNNYHHCMQLNTRYRGNSTKVNQRSNNNNPSSNSNSNVASNNKKDKNSETIFNNIITQVHKQPTLNSNNITKPNNIKQYKSHSLSPNKMLNTMHLSLLPPKASSRKTLVLDLDETLVHSGFKCFNIPSDVVIKIEMENNLLDIHVLVRPGVKEFLERMATKYEIVIFTASLSKYADPLLDIIDKPGHCQYRLFREHCTLINASFVKDLKRLGRDLKDIIIVDNSPISYALHPENGLPIQSWYDDKNDKELYNITPILEFLADVGDVREHIKKMVFDNRINYVRAMNYIKMYMNAIKKSNSSNKDKGEGDKKPQQINIKIINNNITNYICNSNSNNNNVGRDEPLEEINICDGDDNNTINNNNNNDDNDNDNNMNSNSSSSSPRYINNNHKPLLSSNLPSSQPKSNILICNNNNNNLSTSKKDINSFRSTISQHTLPKPPHHKKVESFQGCPSAFPRRSNFLKSSYITTTKPSSPLTNLNINTNNPSKINITNINLLKSTRSKRTSNPIKSHKYIHNSRPITSTSSSSVNKLQKSSTNFFSSTTNGSQTTTNNGHTKSLSFNFDINGINTVRPKSSKKVVYNTCNIGTSTSTGDSFNKRKQSKELKIELNDILSKKNMSRSSRVNEFKSGYKYNVQVGNYSAGGNGVKYTNKIIK